MALNHNRPKVTPKVTPAQPAETTEEKVARLKEADFTPTEDLCLEVLVARVRLGEGLWTFSSRHTRALNSLAEQGAINLMSGIVEKTVRASLTDAGKKAFLYEGYTVPARRDDGTVNLSSDELAKIEKKALKKARKEAKRKAAKKAAKAVKKERKQKG